MRLVLVVRMHREVCRAMAERWGVYPQRPGRTLPRPCLVWRIEHTLYSVKFHRSRICGTRSCKNACLLLFYCDFEQNVASFCAISDFVVLLLFAGDPDFFFSFPGELTALLQTP